LARFRADPLRRLHLDRPAERPELARTSLPEPGAAARARAAIAVREFTDAATTGAPDAWVLAARARTAAVDLPGSLDQAVAGTRLDAERRPRWWRAVGAIQWLLLATLGAGLLWLTGLALLGYFGLPRPSTPTWLALPAPTLLVAGGALLGILLAIGARVAGNIAARRRAARARSRLRAAVGRVADELLVRPVAEEMSALDSCRAGALMAAA
jgi:hypothetical protein